MSSNNKTHSVQKTENAQNINLARVKRAREQEIGILDRQGNNFTVVGTKGDVYKVSIDVFQALHTCTCPDHTQRQLVCKHIYHILMKIYRVEYDEIVSRINSNPDQQVDSNPCESGFDNLGKCQQDCKMCELIYGTESTIAQIENDEDEKMASFVFNGFFPPKEEQYPVEGVEIKSSPIPLIRSLSEHHWKHAEGELLRLKTTEVWAGSSYGSSSCDGYDDWEYWVTREGNHIVRHSRSSSGMEREETVDLPKPKRCQAYNKRRENITGKGTGKVRLRCKNKCYDSDFCSRHTRRFSHVPCSYIT